MFEDIRYLTEKSDFERKDRDQGANGERGRSVMVMTACPMAPAFFPRRLPILSAIEEARDLGFLS